MEIGEIREIDGLTYKCIAKEKCGECDLCKSKDISSFGVAPFPCLYPNKLVRWCPITIGSTVITLREDSNLED